MEYLQNQHFIQQPIQPQKIGYGNFLLAAVVLFIMSLASFVLMIMGGIWYLILLIAFPSTLLLISIIYVRKSFKIKWNPVYKLIFSATCFASLISNIVQVVVLAYLLVLYQEFTTSSSCKRDSKGYFHCTYDNDGDKDTIDSIITDQQFVLNFISLAQSILISTISAPLSFLLYKRHCKLDDTDQNAKQSESLPIIFVSFNIQETQNEGSNRQSNESQQIPEGTGIPILNIDKYKNQDSVLDTKRTQPVQHSLRYQSTDKNTERELYENSKYNAIYQQN